LTVDWDNRMLRVVHAALSKRGPKIERILSAAIPPQVDPSNPIQMGEHLRRVLDQEGITTKHAVVDIPREQAILNTLRLPTGVPDALPGMVEIQIAKQLPFAVADAVIDFAVGGKTSEEGSSSEVLVAAVRHEILQQYEATFTAAGLKLDRIGLRPHANKVAVCRMLQAGISGPGRVLFIDVRPTLTEIDVIRDSFLVFSRAASVLIPSAASEPQTLGVVRDGAAVSWPSIELTTASGEVEAPTASGVLQSLLVEVTRSIEAYRANDPGAVMEQAIIGGDLGVEEALSDVISRRLNIPTEIYNPSSSFGWEPDEGAEAAAFSAALGLVLGFDDAELERFDFLHPKRTVSQTTKRLRKAPLAAAVVLLFAAAGGVGFASITRPDRERLASVERRIAELKQNARDQEKFVKTMAQVRSFDAEQRVWVDVLMDIVTNLPSNEDLVLTHLSMDHKDGRVVLKTKSKNRDIPMEAIRRLQAFRRDGCELPRFRVVMGAQTEKGDADYPSTQDLRITILDDAPKKKGARR